MIIKHIASCLLVASLFSACATTPPIAVPEQKETKPESATQSVEKNRSSRIGDRGTSYGLYLKALMAEKAGKYSKAIGLYNQSAHYDPVAVHPLERATGLYLRMGDINRAVEMGKRGLAIDPDYIPLLKLLGGISSSLKKYGDAKKYFSKMIKLEPTRNEAWIYFAVAAYHNGDDKEALETLDEYTKREPDDPNGYYYKGRIYGKLSRFDDAEKEFKNLIRKFPTHNRSVEALGLLYRAQGKFDDAVKLYKEHLQKFPKDEEIRARLAETYVLQKSYGDAITEYEGLVENEPDDIDLHLKLGVTHFRRAEITGSKDEYSEALREFQMVRAKYPDRRDILFYVATIFERLDLIDESVATWKELIQSDDPANREVYMKIAELYERSGRTSQALSFTKKALTSAPKDPELHYFTGLLLEKLGKYVEAREAFNKAIDLNPASDKYYFYLGVVLEKLKKYEECVEAMKHVIAITPGHSNALNYIGYIYAEQNIKLLEAEEYVKEAIKLEPNNGYFIDSLAWIYFKQKNYTEALEKTLTAIRNIPPDPTVLEHLGDIYRALGRHAEAVNAYERSLASEPEDKRPVDRAIVKQKLKKIREYLSRQKGSPR